MVKNLYAFPHKDFSASVADCSGMLLRDWFAGQALAQVVHDVLSDIDLANRKPSELPAIIAKASYQVADAMLAERENNDG